MKISQLVINPVAKFVCGDSHLTPYMTGPTLVEFFNRHGFNDVYQSGFDSRWRFTENKIREINDTDRLQRVIEDVLDPRRYVSSSLNIEAALTHVNELIKFDGYVIIKKGEQYRVTGKDNATVEAFTTLQVNHEFISEQIGKCTTKIQEGDYNGAITNARSLIEAVCIEIIERVEGIEVKNDGNIDNLWARTKKGLRMDLNKNHLPDSIMQILSGIDTAVKGLAGLSNSASDRHANKFKTRQHHAKLAVNLSLAMVDFLFESMEYQRQIGLSK